MKPASTAHENEGLGALSLTLKNMEALPSARVDVNIPPPFCLWCKLTAIVF